MSSNMCVICFGEYYEFSYNHCLSGQNSGWKCQTCDEKFNQLMKNCPEKEGKTCEKLFARVAETKL